MPSQRNVVYQNTNDVLCVSYVNTLCINSYELKSILSCNYVFAFHALFLVFYDHVL